MSQAYSGVNGIVTSTPSGGSPVDMDVTGWSADVEAGDIDTGTTADEGWADSIDGEKKVSGSFDFLWNPLKNPFGALQALTPGQGLYPNLALALTTGDAIAGRARIQKLSPKGGSAKDGVKFTATFTSKGAWTLPTGSS
jgi:hypothetical protein